MTVKTACALVVLCIATTIASPAQVFNKLVDFNGTNGEFPQASLVQGTDGNFYGTTFGGGATSYGTIFKITNSGTLTTLYSFCSQAACADGVYPYAALMQANDGNFYGTTVAGGVNNNGGTIFKITPSGTLTTLYSFCSQTNCADGHGPHAGLVQATDGNFYGTTVQGGANDKGAIFKITPSGRLTTLYSFCSETNCADGASPLAALIQATDGNFYGTTEVGGGVGVREGGTIFKITSSGTLSTLYTFCSQTNCPDGAYSYAALMQATDGNFYGTTSGGGAGNGDGTIFKITTNGTLTTLYSFCSQTNCADGYVPVAGLIQATDGNFYGTTSYGGVNYAGTIFKITAGGTFTTLYSFGGADGAEPWAGLVQATDGNLYGTTPFGGTRAC